MTRNYLNYIRGIGSMMDLMLASRPTMLGKPIQFQDDKSALGSDWARIGGDFAVAIARADQELYGKAGSEEAGATRRRGSTAGAV